MSKSKFPHVLLFSVLCSLSGCMAIISGLTTVHYKPPQSGDVVALTAVLGDGKEFAYVNICYEGKWQEIDKLTSNHQSTTQKIPAGKPIKIALAWAREAVPVAGANVGGSCIVSTIFTPQPAFKYEVVWRTTTAGCATDMYRNIVTDKNSQKSIDPTAVLANNECK